MKAFTVLVSTFTVTLASVHSEEAPYEVKQDYDEWEVRQYPPTKWISTDAQDVRPHDGSEHDEAFWRLFDYIDGHNNMNTKIDMTAPVTLRIIPGEGPNCESNYTMSFYIPSAFQEDTPTPTGSQVYIEERPAFEVAALKAFGGYPGDVEFGKRGAELYLLAEAAGLPVKDVPLWTAGYSGPGVIINRRNEVWLEI